MATVEQTKDDELIVSWETVGGDKYTGELIEMDNHTGIVRLEDGSIKAVNLESHNIIENNATS